MKAHSGTLYRCAAFTATPEGGNPAGVWVGESLPDPAEMLRVAAEVGFSETAFVAPADGSSRMVRYYSPEAEVSFCGHATIAAGVVLGERSGDGTYVMSTAVGDVPVVVRTEGGIRAASLTSVEPKQSALTTEFLNQLLEVLRWSREDLDNSIPASRAYAGAWHIILAANSSTRLATLDYDFAALKGLMLRDGLTTIQLIWRESESVYHARNPFPVGGVVEDPATGAAAAALGGYLRSSGIVKAPARILIRQGEMMGRPSRLTVDIPLSGGIVVTGNAVML